MNACESVVAGLCVSGDSTYLCRGELLLICGCLSVLC